MPNRTTLNRLIQYHDHLLAVMAQAEALLRSSGGEGTATLSRLRADVSRQVAEFQAFKHNELFDPLIARTDDLEIREAATAMKTRCIAVSDMWNHYVAQWTLGIGAEQGPTYRTAARDMMVRLRSHFQTEREEITALLATQSAKLRPRRVMRR